MFWSAEELIALVCLMILCGVVWLVALHLLRDGES